MMANRHLAKAVADAAMGEAEHPARGGPGQRLSYKCNWYGAELHRGDRWYASSKTCSGCGHKKSASSCPSARTTVSTVALRWTETLTQL